MDEVNIYLYTTIKGPGKKPGALIYILELKTYKGPVTLTKAEPLEDATAHQAELKALIEALKHLNRQCNLSIYTDSDYLAAAFKQGWLENWIKNGWKNSKGEPVANMSEWQETLNLLGLNTFEFHVKKEHSYYRWMRMETEKMVKEKRGEVLP